MELRVSITFPTLGDNSNLLEGLVSASNIPRGNCIVVRTANCTVPTGVQVVDHFGEINIQKWWNLGIEKALDMGSEYVVILNDDLVIAPGTIQQMCAEAQLTGATIITPGSKREVFRSRFLVNRIMEGSLWLLDLKAGLRPDERFFWAYGDDDLDIRARLHYNGIATLPVEYKHLYHNVRTSQSSELTQLSNRDRALFRSIHPFNFFARYVYRRMFTLVKVIKKFSRRSFKL